MGDLYTNLGSSQSKNLQADTDWNKRSLTSIPIECGTAMELPAGTLMGNSGTGGLYAPLTPNDLGGGKIVVLKEAVVLDGTETAFDAAAYLSGTFADGKVTFLDGSEVDAAIKFMLAAYGIYIAPVIEVGGAAPEPVETVTITYVSKVTAYSIDESKSFAVPKGAEYTVLSYNAPELDFTCPSGYDLDSWLGSDSVNYTPGSTLTPEADFTLTAVWGQ